jgi:hypothetical protein
MIRRRPLDRARRLRRPKWPAVWFRVPPRVRFRAVRASTLQPPLVPQSSPCACGDVVEIRASDWLGSPAQYMATVDALRSHPDLEELLG